MSRFVLVAFCILLTASCLAQTDDPDPARLSAEIVAFRDWDSKNSTPTEGILFVGSSSIVGWPTAKSFPNLPIINRGFGGSHVSDVNHYYDDVVKPYSPRTIIFYAGDNDIWDNKSPAQVAGDFAEFIGRVHRELPETRVYFLTIKPSIDRWSKWPEMSVANAKIRDIAAGDPILSVVDVATTLLDERGQPGEFFVEDGLHLNDAGYDRWNDIVRALLY